MIDEKAVDPKVLDAVAIAISGAPFVTKQSLRKAAAAILAYESAKPKEAELAKAAVRADALEAKLAQAVEDEREACATIADDGVIVEAFGSTVRVPGSSDIAQAIRARSASAAARGEA